MAMAARNDYEARVQQRKRDQHRARNAWLNLNQEPEPRRKNLGCYNKSGSMVSSFLAEYTAEQEGEREEKRTWKWRLFRVQQRIETGIMGKIQANVRNVFQLKLQYTYQLKNTDTGDALLNHKTIATSSMLTMLEQACQFVNVT